MINKLLNRKKSYERMMRIDEPASGLKMRSGSYAPEVHQKSSEMLGRPRLHALGGSSVKKNYIDQIHLDAERY